MYCTVRGAPELPGLANRAVHITRSVCGRTVQVLDHRIRTEGRA